jgi:H+/Cl- antiporter ClcA/nitroreductase
VIAALSALYRERRGLLRGLAAWVLLGALVGVLSGVAAAVFLHALNGATTIRATHPWLLYLLPLGGVAVAYPYERWGKAVASGSNLLLEHIHDEKYASAIPVVLAPLVLFGTVVTHLFGGSAGREGTAVQMGGTLASLLIKPLRLSRQDHRLLIMSGISGGFGAVFGTPLAGTVFGMEVLAIGRVSYEALVPCFLAASVGDLICRTLGVEHHVYRIGVVPPLTPLVWALIVVSGALFAGAAAAFTHLTEGIAHAMKAWVKRPLLRPALGGIAIVVLTAVSGSRDYLGLSLPLIERAFMPESVLVGAFAWKILFTAVTLGTGFKGGEVTPLFGIGATLGSAMAHLTGQPTGFFAALGFVAVFAGAANTPLACTLLGIELFGSEPAIPLAAACIVAYVLSGHRGIYSSQRIAISKAHGIRAVAGNSDRRSGFLPSMEKSAATNHPILEALRIRWSPLAFADTPVPTDTLLSLFEAARWSASSFNEQPWRFVIGTRDRDPETFEKLLSTLIDANAAWARHAPVLVLAVAKKTFTANGSANRVAGYDVGQAVGSLTVQATAADLYLHQMGGFSVEKAIAAFAIPDDFEPIAVIALGFLGDGSSLSDPQRARHEDPVRQRRPLTQTVFGGTWDSPSSLLSEE